MSRRIALTVELGIAALILCLGVPQTLSAILRIPADIDLPTLADGQVRDEAIIKSTQAALEAAADQYPSALIGSDIGWSHIYLWRTLTVGAKAQAELNAASSDLRNSLSRSPANSRDWAGLALVRNALSDTQGAADALEQSMMTFPYSPEWSMWRCDLGFLLYPKLSERGRNLLSAQLRYVWMHQPERLLADAKIASFASPNGITLLKTALAADPILSAQFEASIAPKSR